MKPFSSQLYLVRNIQERFHEPSFITSLAHKHCDTGRPWISVCVLISSEVNKKRRFYRVETFVRTFIQVYINVIKMVRSIFGR